MTRLSYYNVKTSLVDLVVVTSRNNLLGFNIFIFKILVSVCWLKLSLVERKCQLNYVRLVFWQFLLFPNVLIICTTIPHFEYVIHSFSILPMIWNVVLNRLRAERFVTHGPASHKVPRFVFWYLFRYLVFNRNFLKDLVFKRYLLLEDGMRER